MKHAALFLSNYLTKHNAAIGMQSLESIQLKFTGNT